MRDPIELYEYPKEWARGREVRKRIESGFYILTPEGWLRRGISTATTASAAIAAAIASLFDDVDEVTVSTPSGLDVSVPVLARKGKAAAIKFAGDHEFDATRGTMFVAEVGGEGLDFADGIARRGGRPVVSRAAMKQIAENYRTYSEKYGYDGGVRLRAVVRGRSGRLNGVAVLGTTGFVEPWCEELVRTKVEIAKRYGRIAVTTGRESWRIAREKFPDFQPFVFGVHLEEILREHDGEIVIVGKPGLLRRWSGKRDEEEILRFARKFANVLEVVLC